MALITTIHLHNVPADRRADYATWFEGPHEAAFARLRGAKTAERYAVTREQIMGFIPQPWQFLSVYDFDQPDPAIDVPALGPLIAEARDAGMIAADETERLYTYDMRGDWQPSANFHAGAPLSGVSIILGNYVIGRKQEYNDWYDAVHSHEVTNVPGHVAMRRGELCATQIEPRQYCPGDQLVLCAQQTEDLAFTVQDFSDRAQGKSASGIAMQPRSDSGSFARTVHYFRKISGSGVWAGGVAYAGDMSVYPGR